MPEHTFSGSFDGIDGYKIINPVSVRKIVKEGHVEYTVFPLDEGALMTSILKSICFPLVGKEVDGSINVRGKFCVML